MHIYWYFSRNTFIIHCNMRIPQYFTRRLWYLILHKEKTFKEISISGTAMSLLLIINYIKISRRKYFSDIKSGIQGLNCNVIKLFVLQLQLNTKISDEILNIFSITSSFYFEANNIQTSIAIQINSAQKRRHKNATMLHIIAHD